MSDTHNQYLGTHQANLDYKRRFPLPSKLRKVFNQKDDIKTYLAIYDTNSGEIFIGSRQTLKCVFENKNIDIETLTPYSDAFKLDKQSRYILDIQHARWLKIENKGSVIVIEGHEDYMLIYSKDDWNEKHPDLELA